MNTGSGWSRTVVVCVTALHFACAFPSAADFDLNTAVGVWHMDEGQGEEAKDSSASGNHAKLWRGPAWVDGRFGKALQFDGQSFAWVRQAKNLPTGTSPRTFMCHFKWAEVNDFANVIHWVTDAEALLCLGAANWRQRVSLQICAEGGPGGNIGVDTSDDREMFKWSADTEWHHAAAVFPDGATKSNEFLMYLDGVRQETFIDDDVNTINSAGSEVAIATWCTGPINYFKGTIDEAAVFPFAMAAEDIANIAKRGLVNGQVLEVSPSGKLATSWGAVKER